MRIKEYLYDRRFLIIFFIILSAFIGGVFIFDSSVRISKSNGEYIAVVSFVLVVIYLGIDYELTNLRMTKISKIIKDRNTDEGDMLWIKGLPLSTTYEEKLYLSLLDELYMDANIQIEKLNSIGNENIEFITTWVHEIKTPISATKLIIENNITSENEKILYCIEGEIEKIDDCVQKALFYSRINDFSKDYSINGVKIEDVVKETLKSEASYFINKKINLSYDGLDIEVDSDYKWLQFIIKQILDNSIKYTSSGGSIRIYSEICDNGKSSIEKVLHIEDDGIGIKKEDIERVFDKSFTGNNGRLKQNSIKQYSTGMGLYISQKLAKKMGHYITIASEYGNGTTVSIHFPKWD